MATASPPVNDRPVDSDHLVGSSPDRRESVDPEVAEFQRQFEAAGERHDAPPVMPEWRELMIATATVSVWFLLFAGGTLISTQQYIQALPSVSSFGAAVGLAAVILLFWTITNVGLLAILAAILGAFGQRSRFAGCPAPTVLEMVTKTSGNRPCGESRRAVYNHYASAVMRGFGVFTLVLSGLLVLGTDSLVAPTQGQYVRLAGLISVVSFYAGYDPLMLAGLLDRIKRFIQSE